MRLLGGFSSFTLAAWCLILIIIIVFGLTIDFIYFEWTRSCFGEVFRCTSSRLGNCLYSSITLFLGKRPVTPTANGMEKCAIFGFAIFTLYVNLFARCNRVSIIDIIDFNFTGYDWFHLHIYLYTYIYI